MWLQCCLAAVAAGASPQTRPDPQTEHRVRPTFGVSSQMGYRVLVVDDSSGIRRDYAPVWKPLALHGGATFYYRPAHSFATGGLRGGASLGAELMSPIAGAALFVQYRTDYVFKVRDKLGLFIGGAVSAHVHLPEPSPYSHLQLGVPLGLATRYVDIVYTAGLSLPLAAQTRAVYGGQMRRSFAVNYMPLNVTLRVKFGGRRPQRSP